MIWRQIHKKWAGLIFVEILVINKILLMPHRMWQIYFGRKKREEERTFYAARFIELWSNEQQRSVSGFSVQSTVECRQTECLENDGSWGVRLSITTIADLSLGSNASTWYGGKLILMGTTRRMGAARICNRRSYILSYF